MKPAWFRFFHVETIDEARGLVDSLLNEPKLADALARFLADDLDGRGLAYEIQSMAETLRDSLEADRAEEKREAVS